MAEPGTSPTFIPPLDVDRGASATGIGAWTHRAWDRSHAPVARVEPGEAVFFDCPSNGLPRDATPTDLAALDDDYPHTLVGPIEIAGAEPGDALVVEILEVRLGQDFGHAFILPGFGFLPDEFGEPYVQNFDLSGAYTWIRDRVRIPVQPFCGIMGVAPAAAGEHRTLPPLRTGGNLDVRQLRTGSTLILPIEVEGALFSVGDGHAAQGDGEVCVTGLETGVQATLRFSLRKGAAPAEPQAIVRGTLDRPFGSPDNLVFTAADPDLHRACRRVVRYVIDHLVAERGLTPEESYILASLLVDLRITQLVNHPKCTVSAFLPEAAFRAE